MTSLQRQFERSLDDAPEIILCQILKRKLKAADTTLSRSAFDTLVKQLLGRGSKRNLRKDRKSGKPPKALRGLTLVFDQEDLDEINAFQAELENCLPNIASKAAEKSGKALFRTLHKRWPAQHKAVRVLNDGFRERLYNRWAEGLDLLHMLLTCSRELAAEARGHRSTSEARKRPCRNFVLDRLHARGCQITDEILSLMENGFADGAMARWRTLHELVVVAIVIEAADEDLAQRYIDHDAVDRKRQADDYEALQTPLGSPPLDLATRQAIDTRFEAMIAKYGKPFGSANGWIADRLNKTKPTFKEIQDEAGRAAMGSYYKLASYNVHAGSRSLFHRLTTLSPGAEPGVGRSNAGLLQPGQNTAYSLLQLTSLTLQPKGDLDRMIEMRSLIEIRDRIPKAFHKADRKLRHDEKAFQARTAARRRKGDGKTRGKR